MKKRKTLKQLYKQHEDAIQIAMIVIIAIAIFSAGYFVSWNFMEKPLNENQFEMCEQIARDVYEQKQQVIVEAPEDFLVSISTTTITVESANPFFRGKVLASLQNGELVMTRYLEQGEAIFFSILMGVLFICVSILIILLGDTVYKKVQKRRQS